MRDLILYFCLICLLFIAISCGQVGYKTTPSGLQYIHLESHPLGAKPKSGQILKLLFRRSISSPITNESAQLDYTAYQPEQIKASNRPYNVAEIFNYLHEGDSVLVVIPLDSMLSKERDLRNVNGYQPGKTVNLYIKLLKILPNDSSYKQDILQVQELALQEEPFKIISYARRHQLYGALKNGVLLSTGRGGSGDLVELGDTLELRYKGFLINGKNGKAFDNNFPTEIGQVNPPLSFVVGSSEIISGFNQAVINQRIGDSINVLIPSKLAYGSSGAGHIIPPNSPLHFCIRLEKLRKAQNKQQGRKLAKH